MKITRKQLKAILVEEIEKALAEGHGDVGMHDMQDPMAKVARLYHTWKPTTPEGEQYHRELGDALGLMKEEKDDDWMQDAFSKKKGSLHRDLGVPEDEDISVSKMADALRKGGKIEKKARAAVNANPEKYGSIKNVGVEKKNKKG